MNLLLDTHVVIWSAQSDFESSGPLSRMAVDLIDDRANTLYFSVVNIWEVAIKNSLGKPGFKLDPRILRRGLLEAGYREIGVSGEHALMIDGLPPIHRDPFDRMLVAQATVEGITLITSDAVVAAYPGPILKV